MVRSNVPEISQEVPVHRVCVITTVPITLTFFSGQVGFLRAHGFDVHAISSPGQPLRDFAAREGISTHGVRMARRISPVADIFALAAMCRVLRRINPVIVHSHTPKGGLLGMIAARLVGVPVRIYHIHGLPHLTATGWRRWLLVNTERIACRLADRVLCVSASIRAVAANDGICPLDRIGVLASGSVNGVDAMERFDPDRTARQVRDATRSTFGIPADARVVGFIGRLVRDKGLGDLAHAWCRLRARYTDAHLLIVGPFDERDRLPENVVRSLRMDSRVHFAGEDRDTPRLYASMDLLCLPSYREGLPVAPLEAAAMRLPVVATRVPGCVDAIVDGRTGTLVPAGDSEALADAIGAYLDDPERRRTHGEEGRRHVLDSFRPAVIWDAQLRTYVQLLETRYHG